MGCFSRLLQCEGAVLACRSSVLACLRPKLSYPLGTTICFLQKSTSRHMVCISWQLHSSLSHYPLDSSPSASRLWCLFTICREYVLPYLEGAQSQNGAYPEDTGSAFAPIFLQVTVHPHSRAEHTCDTFWTETTACVHHGSCQVSSKTNMSASSDTNAMSFASIFCTSMLQHGARMHQIGS